MREQPEKTSVKRTWMASLAVIIPTAVLAVAIVCVALYQPLYQLHSKPQYEPPPFEPGAVLGRPEAPDSFGYGEIDAAGSFAFGLAGVMYQQEDGSLRVYFRNPEDNKAYLMCEVVGYDGETLYRSGLLRPGEHVVSLSPKTRLDNVAKSIEVKVYALDLVHYYSIGTVTLDNTLQPY